MNRRNYVKAAIAFWKLLRNNEDTSQVFTFITALTLESDYDECTKEFIKTDFGRQIIYNNLNVLDRVADVEYLKTLPKNSLGNKYLEFCGDSITTNNLKKVSIEASPKGMSNWPRERIKLAIQRVITHDFVHVLLETGTNPIGEACTLAFNEAQIKQRYNASLILSFFIALSAIGKLGLKVFPMWWEAYQNGKKCKWLCAQDLYPLLALDIEEARKELGVIMLKRYEAVYG
jgi:ubiquinone biosynthesis protein Coq4